MQAGRIAVIVAVMAGVGITEAQTTAAARAAAAKRRAAMAQTASTVPDDTKAVGDIPPIEGKAQPLFALRYIDVKVGDGPLAGPHQFYTVHYTGWTPDGKKFDSSRDRDMPFTFPQGARRVIAGWDLGFEGMHIGGKRRLFVPYQLGYGEAGHPPEIPAKSMLIFDVELLDVSDTPPQPPAAKPDPAAEKPQ